MGLLELSSDDRRQMINDIINRSGTANDISKWYGVPVEELRKFVIDNRERLTLMANSVESIDETDEPRDESDTLTPSQLSDLWITNKFQRLYRLQKISEVLYEQAQDNCDSVTVREFRSYLILAANELGQLLHRGSGESAGDDVLSVDIQGVDMESMR
jgi:hypothetical protein